MVQILLGLKKIIKYVLADLALPCTETPFDLKKMGDNFFWIKQEAHDTFSFVISTVLREKGQTKFSKGGSTILSIIHCLGNDIGWLLVLDCSLTPFRYRLKKKRKKILLSNLVKLEIE